MSDEHSEDKYPNYDPKHWYLSIIKTKTPRRNRLVAIRPLTYSKEDLNKQMITKEQYNG